MTVRFAKYSEQEQEAVEEIVRRARVLFAEADLPFDAKSLRMDLSATHAHMPLRMKEFAEADDFNFAHDVGGIIRHMDRRTGELGGCFVPRFAKPEAVR